MKKPKQTESERRDKYLQKTYGIGIAEYSVLLSCQMGVCAICGRDPKDKNLAVDHLHIKGFKKMLPEKKAKYVRGLLCFICNRYLLGRFERVYKEPRPAILGLVKYIQNYPLKGEIK